MSETSPPQGGFFIAQTMKKKKCPSCGKYNVIPGLDESYCPECQRLHDTTSSYVIKGLRARRRDDHTFMGVPGCYRRIVD